MQSERKHDVKWELLQRFEDGNLGVELNILRLGAPKFSMQLVEKRKDGEWKPRVTVDLARANGVVNVTDFMHRLTVLMLSAERLALSEAQQAEDAYWQRKNEYDARRDQRMSEQGGSKDEQRRRIKQQNGWDARKHNKST